MLKKKRLLQGGTPRQRLKMQWEEQLTEDLNAIGVVGEVEGQNEWIEIVEKAKEHRNL